MSLRIAVVHEAEADFRTATELADRVLLEAVDWMDEHLLVGQREWLAMAPTGRQLTWTGIAHLAREFGIKAHGHFDGKPAEPDAAAARKAILCLLAVIPDLNAIILIRDQDNEPERKIGLEQARDQDRSGKTIIVGLAIVEREAWVIGGFDPQNEKEKACLAAERKTLGFNPCEQSHELTACKDDQAPRSPKRVLKQLCADDRHRERQCWTLTPLSLLGERGRENGLTSYLKEVRERLASLIGHITEN